jgi:hypothetical protein
MESSAVDLELMRQWSERMFGSKHRLPVAVAAIDAERGELYPQLIAKRLGIRDPEVRRQFQVLRGAGLLERDRSTRATRTGGRLPDLYRRTDDEFWRCLEGLGDRFRRRR